MPRRNTKLKEETALSKKTGSKIKVTKTKLNRLGTKVKKTELKKSKTSDKQTKPKNLKQSVQTMVQTTKVNQYNNRNLEANSQPIPEKGVIIRQRVYDRDERQKKIIMWAGVSFFMLLFIGFWLANLKTIFKVDSSAANAKSNQSFEEITNNLSKTMDEVSKNLDKLNNIASTTATSTIPALPSSVATSSATSTTLVQTTASTSTSVNPSQTEINELKARLDILQKQVGTTTAETQKSN